MNNPNPENPPENPVAVVQPLDNRRRLRELLSIPERDRTDEQWDEIIELEIQLAPGNRVSSNEPLGGSPGRNNVMSHGKPGGGSSGGGIGQQQKKIARAPTTIVAPVKTSRHRVAVNPVVAVRPPEWFVSFS